MKLFTMLSFLLLCLQLNAQHYYYNGDKKVILYESKNSYITYEPLSEEMRANFSKTESSQLSKFTILDGLRNARTSMSFQKVTSKQTVPALLLEEAGDFKMYPTKSIRVKMKPGVEQQDVMNLIASSEVVSYEIKFGILEIEIKDIHKTLDFANRIYESGLAEFSTPNFHMTIVKNQQGIQDPLFPLQFQMNNTGQVIDGVAGINDMDCNALEAWELALGNNVVVAVIDDGLEAHEDLGSRLIGGFTPLTNGNGSPVNNVDNHGMSCAGIIGASHNTLGVRGIAPNVDFLGINIFASANPAISELSDGIRWAVDNGADVISNSWSFPFAPCDFTVIEIEDALQYAADNGVVVVFSAGNQGGCVEYPATNPNVIAVGAFDNRGVLFNFSATGAELDLTAPSGLTDGLGNIRTIDRMNAAGTEPGNTLPNFGGTSAAAPVVAGAAALVLSANPNLSPIQVRDILVNTATDMGANGFDNNFGFGRVNARAAVEEAINETASLSGISYLCFGQPATAFLSNQLNASVSWTSSSNVLITSSNNQSAIAEPRTSSSSGHGWIRARFGNNTTKTLNIWVGPASFTSNGQVYVQGFYGQSSITLAGDALYTFQAVGGQGNTGYTWHLPPGFSFNGSSTSSVAQIWTSENGGNYTLVVRPVNPCGSEGGTRTIDIYIPGTGGGGGIGPDPTCPEPPCQIPHANSYGVNSNSTTTPKVIYQDMNKNLILRGFEENSNTQLYTLSGQKVLDSTKGTLINTNGIRSGIYLIIVNEDGAITRQKIILN